LWIEPDRLAVRGDGVVIVALGAVGETTGECILRVEPSALPGISDNAIDLALQHVLYILTAGHLRIGGSKAALPFAFADERAGENKCIMQIRRAVQRSIEKGFAEVGPIVSILAAERCVIGVRRGDDQGVRIREWAYENA